LEQEYIKTGKVKYVALDFPLESIHKNAFKAAEAAHCAGAQGKYWEMHARLFANQGALGLNDLPPHAEALGLAMPAFQQCLESGQYAEAIRNDLASGQQAGVTGTPAFFFGVTEPNDSKVKSLRMITGAQPYAAFQAAINSLLSEQK
jgi:protein-disulfide isomerase